MSAVSAGREMAVNLLLKNGADVNAKNSSGQTALHYAVQLPPTLLHTSTVLRAHHANQSSGMYTGYERVFCLHLQVLSMHAWHMTSAM